MKPRVAEYLVVVIAMVLFASNVCAEPGTPRKKPQTVNKRITELEKEVSSLKKELAVMKMPAVPGQLSLCEKPIPLSDEGVRENFEREFYQFLDNKGLLTILVKRYGKFLNVVSEEIDILRMPSDLIYLAIAESYLNPRAVSNANAGGMWQFIRDTGKREGLAITDHIDERYSVKRSTRSALTYLRKLNGEFGDWLLAMAAYNCGEGRVREAIANQNTRDFFEMFLPQETQRYIFRIAALKEILANPRKYGVPLDKKDYYRPYSVAEIALHVDKEAHTLVLSQAMDLSYKTFREYNLHIRKYALPRGTYRLYVPIEKKEMFIKRIRTTPNMSCD
jgi:hypothetical protein